MKFKSLAFLKLNLSFLTFLICLMLWFAFVIFGAFSDPNVTIQESANIWQERLLFNNNPLQFLLSGHFFGHQHLYHILVYLLADSFGYYEPSQSIYIARIISIIFGFCSLIAITILIKNYIKNTNAYLITAIIALHPLFLFYCIQAEPYSMLFFISTVQLLIYFKLEENKASHRIFVIVSILGFFTHYYFLILPLAECFNEIIGYIKNKKMQLLPFYTAFGLFIIFLFHAPAVLTSPVQYYQDGYSTFSWTLILKMLAIFGGITSLIFSDSMVYFLSIILLITLFYLIFKNGSSIPQIIVIYFISLLVAFSFFSFISFLNNWTYPVMRHYMQILLPGTIIVGLAIDKYKINRSRLIAIIASILFIFIYTDYKNIYTKYKYDGLSVIHYIHQKTTSTGHNNYLTLINPDWAGNGLLSRSISYSNLHDPNPIESISHNTLSTINIVIYKRSQIHQFWEMSITALFPKEYWRAAYALSYRIYMDTGVKIDNVENFIHQKSTNNLLGALLKKKACELNDLEILFLKDTKIKIYNKNRLLLEILYPQLVPNIIRRELRIEDKISDIIDSRPEVSCFFLLYVNEFILGLDVLDTNIQKTAINSMMSDNRLNLQEIKEFTNVKIFTFVRKK